jgi:hypothetical protein
MHISALKHDILFYSTSEKYASYMNTYNMEFALATKQT